MIVAVMGCGNVGANLLQHIADVPSIDKTYAIDVSDDIVKAAIMDVAGFKPHGAHKIESADYSCLGKADVIAITAGVKAGKEETAKDVFKRNMAIIDRSLGGVRLKESVVVIHLPSPVEVLVTYIGEKTGLLKSQVIGFGGNLDLNRLVYVLEDYGIPSGNAAVIGEHGARAIPVYEGEEKFEAVSSRVRNFLGDIGNLAGQKRNLATAPLLGDLIRSIVEDRKAIHYVSGFHPDYGMVLLWPFRIGGGGTIAPEPLNLPPRAEKEFESFLKTKRSEKVVRPKEHTG